MKRYQYDTNTIFHDSPEHQILLLYDTSCEDYKAQTQEIRPVNNYITMKLVIYYLSHVLLQMEVTLVTYRNISTSS